MLTKFHEAIEEPAKPGWSTSELWAAVSGLVLSLLPVLYIMLKVKPEDQTALTQAIETLGTLGVAVAGQAAIIWKYIASRQAVKEQAIAATAQVHSAELEQNTAIAQFQAEREARATRDAVVPQTPFHQEDVGRAMP